MNQRITIQTNTPTRGTDGASVDSWADSVTVWAEKLYRGSREFMSLQSVNAEITEVFIIRNRSVDAQDRIKYGSRYFDIIGTFDPTGRGVETHILCKETV